MAKLSRGHHFMSGFGNEDYLEDYLTHRGLSGRSAFIFSENNERYKIEVGIPGLCREDISIMVSGNTLIVAENQDRSSASGKEISHQEFDHKHFRRSFSIPEDAVLDEVNARCENGLLNIEIPKSGMKLVYRQIEIK
jgi:HSP20 family protein